MHTSKSAVEINNKMRATVKHPTQYQLAMHAEAAQLISQFLRYLFNRSETSS